jgi:hypothetical protein
MPKFRKKPVVIEAVQFTGKNAFEIFKFIGDKEALDCDMIHSTDNPVIETLDGRMECRPGDWVIRGINGEHYPCKPDIFEKTYEPVQQSKVS